MSTISTHVLDLALGRPAAKLAVRLELLAPDGSYRTLGAQATDLEGRIRELVPPGALEARSYRLVFETGPYFAASQRASLYPEVQIVFQVAAPREPHHIPLLLSPFGYSTYRGS